jgi:MFS superfamily sulfate permease-like transporter
MNSIKINRSTIGKDALAGLTAAIAAIPDGIATAFLVPRDNLFFAAARDFEEKHQLLMMHQCAVEIINLRGRLQVGRTFMGVPERDSQALQANGGILYLVNVSDPIYRQLQKNGTLQVLGADSILPTSGLYLGSLQSALTTARKWLADEANQENTE